MYPLCLGKSVSSVEKGELGASLGSEPWGLGACSV